MTKVKLKVKVWNVVSEAVEHGVVLGYNRAHKHTDNPDADMIQNHIQEAVMIELSEVVDFDD